MELGTVILTMYIDKQFWIKLVLMTKSLLSSMMLQLKALLVMSLLLRTKTMPSISDVFMMLLTVQVSTWLLYNGDHIILRKTLNIHLLVVQRHLCQSLQVFMAGRQRVTFQFPESQSLSSMPTTLTLAFGLMKIPQTLALHPCSHNSTSAI